MSELTPNGLFPSNSTKVSERFRGVVRGFADRFAKKLNEIWPPSRNNTLCYVVLLEPPATSPLFQRIHYTLRKCINAPVFFSCIFDLKVAWTATALHHQLLLHMLLLVSPSLVNCSLLPQVHKILWFRIVWQRERAATHM